MYLVFGNLLYIIFFYFAFDCLPGRTIFSNLGLDPALLEGEVVNLELMDRGAVVDAFCQGWNY